MSISNHNGMWAGALDSVWHDVRLALRILRRSPGFTATIALTLALGIGANAAIFGVINSLLLRPVPVADPDQPRRASRSRITHAARAPCGSCRTRR